VIFARQTAEFTLEKRPGVRSAIAHMHESTSHPAWPTTRGVLPIQSEIWIIRPTDRSASWTSPRPKHLVARTQNALVGPRTVGERFFGRGLPPPPAPVFTSTSVSRPPRHPRRVTVALPIVVRVERSPKRLVPRAEPTVMRRDAAPAVVAEVDGDDRDGTAAGRRDCVEKYRVWGRPAWAGG